MEVVGKTKIFRRMLELHGSEMRNMRLSAEWNMDETLEVTQQAETVFVCASGA